jgi:hypothetical protein
MESDRPYVPNPRIGALLWNLPIDAATLEVVMALRARGIDSVVLKGPALSDWYPEDSGRTYGDGDVWVAPAAVDESQGALAELGFQASKDESGLPGWWAEHASDWFRVRDNARIDLHAYLQGVAQDPVLTWAALWPRCVDFELAGTPVKRLPADARALYVALHATHHGIGRDASIEHLGAALAAVDDTTWTSSLELARELNALDSFATGLRLLPAGAELATRIGVPDARTVRTSLLASSPPPVALGFDQLSRAGVLRRLEILARKLFPPPGFIRHWWEPAARNRQMLVLGYLYRPVWLLRHAPAGYRAWRAARRDASNSS